MIWTIYDHPSDYPDHFVVRAHVIAGKRVLPTAQAILCTSLEDARSRIPAGRQNVGRLEADDPVIVESWA